jgi:hypothetical protein
VKKTIVLGKEYDADLRRSLIHALTAMGGTMSSPEWGVGGSQEMETLEVCLGDQTVVVESETYIGLSITGEESLLERILRLLPSTNGEPG